LCVPQVSKARMLMQ